MYENVIERKKKLKLKNKENVVGVSSKSDLGVLGSINIPPSIINTFGK